MWKHRCHVLIFPLSCNSFVNGTGRKERGEKGEKKGAERGLALELLMKKMMMMAVFCSPLSFPKPIR
jgi:hypothetical protein